MFHTCSLRVGYAKLTLLKDTSPFTASSGSFSPPLRGILGWALMNYKENDIKSINMYIYKSSGSNKHVIILQNAQK